MNYQYAGPDDKVYTEVTRYERPVADPRLAAEKLRAFAEENFVLVHIEYRFSPDGRQVLEQTGAAEHFTRELPSIFTVTSEGTFAAALDAKSAETRRDSDDWFRGDDRSTLIAALSGMIDARTK